MNNITFLSSNNRNLIRFDAFNNKNPQTSNSAYIKNQIHEKNIDEFFFTDVNAPHKKNSLIALFTSIVGVAVPVLYFSKKQNPNLKINSLKNIYKALNINYDLKEILTVGNCGILGGLIGGLIDRKEPKKLEKIQEATYQVMNVTFPAVLVANGMKTCERFKPLNNRYAKLLAFAAGLGIGTWSAVKSANYLDNYIFDKHNIDPERKLRAKDFIVHVDDLAGSLVLAKFPFAEKLQVNKLIPLIFAWCGFHVGEK